MFKKLHIHYIAAQDKYKTGKGTVFIIREDPKEIVMNKGGDTSYFSKVKYAYEHTAKAGNLIVKNNFFIQRGPYVIASVLKESTSNDPLVIDKKVIDLFNPELPVLQEKIIQPGTQAFLYNLEHIQYSKPQVLAAASRVYQEKINNKEQEYSFITKSLSHTIDVMRIVLPSAPKEVTAILPNSENVRIMVDTWDQSSHTLLLKFENYSEGVSVNIHW